MNYRIHFLRTLIALPYLSIALAIPATAADEKTPLEKEMAKIDQGYKTLSRQARTGQFDYRALGKAFAQAKTASEAAAVLVPAKIANMKNGAAKNKAMSAYRKQIGDLTKQLSAIVAICKAKDAAKLNATFAELKKMKKQGHEQFTDDE